MAIEKMPEANRPRGRPKTDDRGSAVTTWVPTAVHDKLIVLANQSGKSVSAIVRILLESKIPSK
jgi:hypothetical protein